MKRSHAIAISDEAYQMLEYYRDQKWKGWLDRGGLPQVPVTHVVGTRSYLVEEAIKKLFNKEEADKIRILKSNVEGSEGNETG